MKKKKREEKTKTEDQERPKERYNYNCLPSLLTPLWFYRLYINAKVAFYLQFKL